MKTIIEVDGDVDARIGDEIDLHCGTYTVLGVSKLETALEIDSSSTLPELLELLELKLKHSGP